MKFQLPTPSNLSEIRGCVLTYIIQAPHFQSYRRATTYDFTGDDVLKSIQDGISVHARKVVAKKPCDSDRPARWMSYVQDARRLLAQGDVQGSIQSLLRLQHEYYGRVRNDSTSAVEK
jgi:hypothetical protein